MAQIMHQVGVMMRFVLVLMALVLLGTATEAPAACRRFGTQLECDLGASQPADRHASGSRARLRRGSAATAAPGGDLDFRPRPRWPFRLELQNVGVDPSLCRKIGNETYCYLKLSSRPHRGGITLSRRLNSSFGNAEDLPFLTPEPPSVPRKYCKTAMLLTGWQRKMRRSPIWRGFGRREE